MMPVCGSPTQDLNPMDAMTTPQVPQAPQIKALMAQMQQGLLERDAAVRLTLLAALAGEHVLLMGPPGTAKSELARRLQHAFADARYFERLLTRFSVPEELFGPLSLKALENDRYERLTDGYLPTASVAFLDEVFKANSAILNALLTLLNEREFDNGTGRTRTPLICVIGATNEVPSDEALQAFFDRFLLRVPVAAVGDASFDALLDLGAPSDAPRTPPLTTASLHALRAASESVVLGDDVRAHLHALRTEVAQLNIVVSDRRWRQLAQLLRLEAASQGQPLVTLLDLWLVPYALADKAEHVPELQAWFVDQVMQAPPEATPWLERAVEAFEKQFDLETRVQQQDDGQAGKIALARALTTGNPSAVEDGMPRMVSQALEESLRKRFSPIHIQARVAQVNEVLAKPQAQCQAWREQAASVQARATAHLWLPPTLRLQMQARHDAAVASLSVLVQRLLVVRDAFAQLPVDAKLAGSEPSPVDLAAAA